MKIYYYYYYYYYYSVVAFVWITSCCEVFNYGELIGFIPVV
jgi:hypothetical protein